MNVKVLVQVMYLIERAVLAPRHPVIKRGKLVGLGRLGESKET